jgi:hypothetical protein
MLHLGNEFDVTELRSSHSILSMTGLAVPGSRGEGVGGPAEKARVKRRLVRSSRLKGGLILSVKQRGTV